MKFFNRKIELEELEKIEKQSHQESKMVVLIGRRRIGKTLLATEFMRSHRSLYLFIEKKTESLLARDLMATISLQFPNVLIGEITSFKDVFRCLLEIGKNEKLVVVIDEFQEFLSINPAIFSECQHLWDLYKYKSKLLLIFIGSVFSLMQRIFQNAKEPLFGRADRIFHIAPFTIQTTHQLLKQNGIPDIKSLFDCYLITGGMPKYLDLLITNNATELDRAISFILSDFSPFLEEGKHLLIEEFGKEYGTYFSILELISSGKTSRSEIESVIGSNIGGFLDRLEMEYSVISRVRPFGNKPGSRTVKYLIQDNFLNFWFRFLYRNAGALEAKNFQYVKEIFHRDYPIYAGKILEKFFRELLSESKNYNQIGNYWEKGNMDEIDIIAVNDMKKKLLIAEVKLNPKKIDLHVLKEKASHLLSDYPNYEVEYRGFSLKDAENFII